MFKVAFQFKLWYNALHLSFLLKLGRPVLKFSFDICKWAVKLEKYKNQYARGVEFQFGPIAVGLGWDHTPEN